MSRSKRGGVIAAVVMVVLSLAAVAVASTVSPKNGTYKGKAHYEVSGKRYSASLTITVAKHKISRVQMLAKTPVPVDQKTSTNSGFCAAQSFDTKNYKRTGSISKDGAFKYTFKSNPSGSDRVTVTGTFKSATKAVGTYRDIYTIPAMGLKCDTGKLPFLVKHS